MHILFIDTETTGKALHRLPPTDPAQPRLVQLGAELVDENRAVVRTTDTLVRPDGWEIPAEATAIHGITTDLAAREGHPVGTVLHELALLVAEAAVIVAHNADFDLLVLRSEYARAGKPDPFVGKGVFCTMRAATAVCQLPGRYGFKWPSLDEAHRHFFGVGVDGAHDSLIDVRACRGVYFALVDTQRTGLQKAG